MNDATSDPMHHWYDLGPVEVGIVSALAEIFDEFEELYAGQRIDAPQRSNIIRIEVRAEPAGHWRRRYAVVGDGVELFDDLAADEVLPYVEWGINHRFLAARRPYLIFHAAALARGGAGVMLVGASGSGKSTLTAALAAEGWDYLGDEFALLDPHTLELHPFRKALCVKSGSFELVRSMGLQLWRKRGYVKAFKGEIGFIPPRHLSQPAGPVFLRSILLPHFAGVGLTAAHRLPASRLAYMLAENAFNRDLVGPDLPRLLGRLATECTCLSLETGDVRQAAWWLDRYLHRDAWSPGGRLSEAAS